MYKKHTNLETLVTTALATVLNLPFGEESVADVVASLEDIPTDPSYKETSHYHYAYTHTHTHTHVYNYVCAFAMVNSANYFRRKR